MAQSNKRVEGSAQDHAETAAHHASPWISKVARYGYVAKGVVYATIGVLAMLEALGMGGKTASPDGAVKSLGFQPFGAVLLVVLAAGLLGYALWKLVQGVMDPDDKGSDALGIIRRGSYVVSALIHGALGYTAAQSVFGAEDSSEDAMAASAMAYQPPLGRILVATVGVIVLVVCLYQLYAAFRAKFIHDLKLHEMTKAQENWVNFFGRTGTIARAIAIGVAGSFVLLAAYEVDPKEVRGLGGALETIQQQPWGAYMLGAISVGFVIYGLFMFSVARHREISAT